MPRWFSIASRLAFLLLALLTSIYCLLAYIPDTYFAFIQAPFQPWLVELIQLHAYLFSAVLMGLSVTLLAEYRTGQSRRMALQFIVFHAAVAIFFLARKPFSHLGNNSLSFLWSLAALFPVLWIGILDHSAHWETRDVRKQNPPRQVPFRLALLAAVGIGLLYPGSEWLRYTLAGRPVNLVSADFVAWGWALLVHVLFGIFAICLFNLACALALRTRGRELARFLVSTFLVAIAVGLLFQRVLLASLPFAGLAATIYSGVIALALVLFFGGIWPHQRKFADHRPALTAFQSWREAPGTQNALLALVLLGSIYTVPALIGVLDWNSVLAKFWAATLWICVLVVLGRMWSSRAHTTYPVWLLLLLGMGSFGAYRLLQTDALWPQPLRTQEAALSDALSRHASFDASYEAVRDLWTISNEKSCDSLCEFLNEQTGIPPFVPVQPVNVKLVDPLTPAPGPKPNIFIFVVDSLRRDYVSPYNPAAQFTPRIGEFAAESVVMHNSFTRYAGTTLSEPAIWAGSLLLHKHYVQPFHPMNNLEKLLDADGYDRFVSVDTVLRLLLQSSPQLHNLDSSLANWADQDLCTTTIEAEQKIDARQDKSRPIFLYTQPQNIHIVALQRALSVRPPQPSQYPGFQPSAATEIKRMDGCFGDFIHYLKSRGLYDNSIIVLTADHGESYGENGHISHAFGLHPEVLRIPLIIHLPQQMRKRYYYDAQAIAFNIDVTPTLYYLLGHRPVANDERFGKPLFTLTQAEHAAYLHDSYLVAVCYGPIYGILGGEGESLFVANEMDAQYQYFDLVHDPGGTNNIVDGKVLADHQRLIRKDVQSVADLYHYRYHQLSLINWMMR